MNEKYRQMQMREQFSEFPKVLTEEEAYLFDVEKSLFGCAMRSLESITGIQGSYEEWESRIDIFEKQIQRRILRFMIEASGLPTEDFANFLKKETISLKQDTNPLQEVVDFYQQISKLDSPLGAKIREVEIIYKSALGEILVQEIVDGKNVILSSPGHVAHVGIENGRIVSLSDNHERQDIQLDTKYHYLILNQKPEK